MSVTASNGPDGGRHGFKELVDAAIETEGWVEMPVPDDAKRTNIYTELYRRVGKMRSEVSIRDGTVYLRTT